MNKMHKRIIIPTIVFCCCLLLVNGVSAEQEGGYFYTVSDGEATITGWTTRPGEIVEIPSRLGNYPVTKIGDYLFLSCPDIKTVTIPTSVEYIGKAAFRECTGLKSILIPNNVTVIDNEAFYGCTELQSVSIPNSVTKIMDKAFWHCEKLKDVTIPAGVTDWGSDIFTCCYSLETISLPNDMACIPPAFLASCSSLTSIVLPDTITEIFYNAFASTGLQTISIPNGVDTIGNRAFYNCSNLVSVTMPDTVKAIEKEAFLDCTLLENVYYNAGYMEWRAIAIGEDNEPLSTATVHYNNDNSYLDGVIYNVAYDGEYITAAVEKKESVGSDAYIYLAVYDADNRLLHLRRISAINNYTPLNENISVYTNAASAKIMFLYNDLRPLCMPGMIDLLSNNY